MPNFIAKPPLAALGEGMLHVPHVPGEQHDRQSATPCQAECALLGKLALTTDDKIYCVYVACDEHAVRAHAQKGGFPADVIARVHSVIDPTTAEAGTA